MQRGCAAACACCTQLLVPRRADRLRRKWRRCNLCTLVPLWGCFILLQHTVTLALAPRLRYTAAKAASEQQQASLAELQQQKQQALSQRDFELAEVREAMQRAVAEKERYKVAPSLIPHAAIQRQCDSSHRWLRCLSLRPTRTCLVVAAPYPPPRRLCRLQMLRCALARARNDCRASCDLLTGRVSVCYSSAIAADGIWCMYVCVNVSRRASMYHQLATTTRALLRAIRCMKVWGGSPHEPYRKVPFALTY